MRLAAQRESEARIHGVKETGIREPCPWGYLPFEEFPREVLGHKVYDVRVRQLRLSFLGCISPLLVGGFSRHKGTGPFTTSMTHFPPEPGCSNACNPSAKHVRARSCHGARLGNLQGEHEPCTTCGFG